ncbi:MAG: 30S ribosomal protein S16 [Anaerolineae bacterium]|jgi:small subunit ribosomal protein S16|nr:MAG: 30S ribosomal protein S16 [Anaerolineae bacterium]
MVKIRLRRVGLKGQPSYRIVVADKEAPRDGRFLEIVGFYNPRTHPATIQIAEDRVYDWMSKGAQPTESTAKLFQSVGLFERFQRYKNGEALDILLKEAAAVQASRNVQPKTSLSAQKHR